MKANYKVQLPVLFWFTIPLIIIYFKWAAQDMSSFPGLPAARGESFGEVVINNFDVIIVSVLGSVPTFYMSLYYLTPKYLFNSRYLNYIFSLAAYSIILVQMMDMIIPMYFFFGIPYAIKILGPVVFVSACGGSILAFNKIKYR